MASSDPIPGAPGHRRQAARLSAVQRPRHRRDQECRLDSSFRKEFHFEHPGRSRTTQRSGVQHGQRLLVWGTPTRTGARASSRKWSRARGGGRQAGSACSIRRDEDRGGRAIREASSDLLHRGAVRQVRTPADRHSSAPLAAATAGGAAVSFAAVLERLQTARRLPTRGSGLSRLRNRICSSAATCRSPSSSSRLERNRFLAVLGVSGSGKSSLVRAGLIPALERGRVSEAGRRWRIVVTRPAARRSSAGRRPGEGAASIRPP